ncbi:MAG TPA: hypothetical protein PLO83_11810, partial [Gammaproteobacteria bacterium]|nr:hypothetical protein [Gammaproteobacteria bacterium]
AWHLDAEKTGGVHLISQAIRRVAPHSDAQHSALARAWLRHFCPTNRSMLSAAYLGVSSQKTHTEYE